MNVAKLKDKALMVRIPVSCFVGNPRDLKLTAEAAEKHDIARARVSTRKRIMQGPKLDKVLNLGNRLRKEVECISLPWQEGGFRLIPSRSFVEIKQKIDSLIRDFNSASDEFILDYDAIIEHDKKPANEGGLGDAFNKADYPRREELRSKFRAFIEVSRLPVHNDWRVDGIDATMQAEIAQQVDTLTQERIKAGQNELLENMRSTINHLLNRLKDSGSGFKNNSIKNVIEAAQKADSLNVTEDKGLANVADEVAKTFGQLDADAIRDNAPVRKIAVEVCEAALADIEKAMEGIY